jgi:hypothetical protein
MSRLSPYVNEIVGFIIMLLMLIALIVTGAFFKR